MKKTTATLLAGLFISLFSFGQNALFISAPVRSGETRIDYTVPSAQPGLLESSTILLAVNPRLGFSFLSFSAKEHFHQAGLYNLHFNRYENHDSQQPSGGTQVITRGTKLVTTGGGLLYRYGWKGGRAGENWLFHVSAKNLTPAINQ